METGFIRINIEEGKAPTVEAQLANNTIWMSKITMAKLLNCYPQKIEANLRTLFKEHLLWESDCTYNYRYTDKGIEKQCLYYSLEVLIFMSYRVNTFEAKIFRQFVNSSLRNELQKCNTPEIKLLWEYKQNCNYWLN